MISAQGFQDLYQAQLGAVYNYVRYRLGDAEAEDLTAAVFTRAWDQRSRQDAARGSPEAWLWSMTRSMVADRRRWLRRRPVEPLAEDLPSGDDLSGLVLQGIEWERLAQALDLLPEPDQELIALRFGAGLPHRAIAAELDLTEAACAQRLHRALRRLRALLTAGPMSTTAAAVAALPSAAAQSAAATPPPRLQP